MYINLPKGLHRGNYDGGFTGLLVPLCLQALLSRVMLEPPGPSGVLSPMTQEEEEEEEEKKRGEERESERKREKRTGFCFNNLCKKEVKAGLRILEEWRNQGLGSSFSCW